VNVKAGVRLLIADARVGELYAIPLQPAICDMNPTSPSKKILKKRGDLAAGNLLDLHMYKSKFMFLKRLYRAKRGDQYLPKITESGRRRSVETI
jgi:hypothetical protein